MRLAEMLLKMNEAERAPPILPEAAVARLREAAARCAEQLDGPRFKIGDLVTPVRDSDLKGVGEPHHIIEVRPGAAPDFGEQNCSNCNGGRLDIRVLSLVSGRVSAYWAESFKFEAWTAPATEAADVRAAD